MKRYPKAKCQVFIERSEYIEGRNFECEVLFTPEQKLKVSYPEYLDTSDTPTPITWVGNPLGEGHYELKCDALKGRASLHMFPGGEILVGEIREDRKHGPRAGMWNIRLAA